MAEVKIPKADRLHKAFRPCECPQCDEAIQVGDQYRWIYMRPNLVRAHPNCAQRFNLQADQLAAKVRKGSDRL